MKTSTLTIRLDKDLDDLLTKASRRSGRNRSEIAREALRRQLRISQFEGLGEVFASHEFFISARVLAELSRVLRLKFGVGQDLIDDFIWLLRQDSIAVH